MRITLKSVYEPFLNNLQDVQSRKFKEEVRLSTGKQLTSLSDSPKKVINIKHLTEIISRNEKYKNNIESSLEELRSVDDQIRSITDKVQKVRDLAVEATLTSSSTNLAEMAEQIKMMLEDIVRDANMVFGGQFMFSGTKTIEQSIIPTAPEQNNLPFELVTNINDENNPSRLEVHFKGNLNERLINKDSRSSEVINTKADELFGSGNTQLFTSIINLYNLLKYNSQGSIRTDKDFLSKDDLSKLNEYQKEIEKSYDLMNVTASRNGARLNRLESLSSQLSEEIIRLKEFRSLDEDTDYAKTAVNLAKEENALQYTLQVGSKLGNLSLFDFLR